MGISLWDRLREGVQLGSPIRPDLGSCCWEQTPLWDLPGGTVLRGCAPSLPLCAACPGLGSITDL